MSDQPEHPQAIAPSPAGAPPDFGKVVQVILIGERDDGTPVCTIIEQSLKAPLQFSVDPALGAELRFKTGDFASSKTLLQELSAALYRASLTVVERETGPEKPKLAESHPNDAPKPEEAP